MSLDEPPDSSPNGPRPGVHSDLKPVVIVLAGGVSNRLWPLRDKLLIEYGSMTLLERHIALLQTQGYERFIIVARPDTVGAIAEIGRAIVGAAVSVVEQAQARGMADAVLSARSELEALGDVPIYITQAHDVVDPSLHAQMLDQWRSHPCDGLIAAAKVDTYFPGGYLTLEGERVTSVVEKPGAGNEPSDLVNLVAHTFASWRELADALDKENASEGPDDAYERALSQLMKAGHYRAVVYQGAWRALKFPWHVLDVMDLLLERWSSGQESPGDGYEQREGGIFIGRDVRIFPGSHVVGPALIGHGSVIGHNALVRGSVVGRNCVVGFGSEVARSYLAEAVELHHNYVGDSVFDRETAMGYGAVTANYRLDGRTVPMLVGKDRLDSGRMKLGLILGARARLGVNASTMPGVKIGADAMIGPNLRVTRDVPDAGRVLNEREYGRL